MISPRNILSLLPLLLLHLGPAQATTGDLINQTCKDSAKGDPHINSKFCIYALQSYPASRCANLTRLGLISITLAKNNVTDTHCMVKRYLKDKKPDKATRTALKDCLELYSDSSAALSEAKKDFKERMFVDANVKVSSVFDASSTCEEGFEEIGVPSPLRKENGHISQLSAISLSIINMFHSTN